MDPAVLATLSRLLDEALDRSPAERQPWLDSLGPEYDTVRPRLERLLRIHETPGPSDFLGTLPRFEGPQTAGGPASGDSSALPGSTIGPYRLIQELAAGGMGSVWLAERIDGLVKRPVALKLPRGAWRRLGLGERMARERDILATLEHPHIARLYDAGLAADGQPYLALEYVVGEPIDVYCDRAGLDVPARLRLFQQVVGAVVHAHSRLIVHRDLKPSNILVTAAGEVRLLDFGIAKLLEGAAVPDSTLTQASGRALTPAYASPEQITGAPIGTASDVYSLGVILYELLARTRPYRPKRESAGALEDAIVDAELLRPSLAAADPSLRRVLHGDLDWIVARAMAKTPAARYSSAEAFGADIERYLQQQPVEAAAPGRAYRLRKFVRRHRTAVAVSMLVAVVLLGGIVGTTIGLVRARAAQVEAQASAATARIEAATAERVTEFLVQLFDVATPEEADGRAVTAREMLDRGAARVRAELSGEPVVQARLLGSLGNAYSALALYAEARPLLEEAVAVSRTIGSRGERDLADGLVAVAQLRRRLDDAEGAERAVREALEIRVRLDGEDSPATGPALNELALLLRTKDPDEAVRLYRRVFDMLVAEHGPADGDAGIILANIGAVQTRTRAYAAARESLTQALAIVTPALGENDPRVGGIAGNLAVVERELGNNLDAIALHHRDLEVSTRALGAEHPAVGTIWLNLARTTQRTGDYASALAQVEKALAIFRMHFGPGHSLLLTSENSHAQYLRALGRVGEARRVLERALAAAPDSNEGFRAAVAGRLQLAEIEREARRFEPALTLAQRALDDPVTARDPKLLADATWLQACVLVQSGSRADAERARNRATEVQEADPLATAAARAYAQARYAACGGDHDRAVHFLQQAIAAGLADPWVLVDPVFHDVRQLARFPQIRDAVMRAALKRTPQAPIQASR